MKFLHTSDLHLGKRLNDVSLIEDQAYILKQIEKIAVSEGIDAVLIPGDIYQKASPSAEAMALFDEFLSDLVKANIKVFLISGNHDSEQRISYFSSLIRKAGVYSSEKFEGKLQQITLSDEYGEIVVSLLPFFKPVQLKRFFPEEEIGSYDSAMAAILKNSEMDFGKRNIILAHQFITGSECSDSEEEIVGTLESMNAAAFSAFDYAALGHIHKPQSFGEYIRYSGSPLRYSFSEISHSKSVVIIDLKEKGNTEIELVGLRPIHELREISGNMADIMRMPYSEDHLRIIVTDEEVPPDAVVSLSTVFPNVMSFGIRNSKTAAEPEYFSADYISQGIESKSTQELFYDFYKLQNSGAEPGSAISELLLEVLAGLEGSDEADKA